MQYNLYIFSIVLIVACVIAGRHITVGDHSFSKFIYLHVLLGFSVESAGLIINHYYNESTLLYNIYILADIPVLALAGISASAILKKNRNILYVFLAGYVATWVFFVFKDPDVFANWVFVAGSIILFVLYFILLIEYFVSSTRFTFVHPVVITSFGTLIYYASNIPIFSFMPYLGEYNRELAGRLYVINILLSCVHYVFILISLLFARKKYLINAE